MEEKADISIMGCGWLGMPLADRFINSGYRVKGSTTTPDKLATLREKKIEPYLLNLAGEETDQEALADFLNARVLILNIPPRLRTGDGDNYLQQLHRLLKAMCESPVSRVLFVSSTSVYLNLNRVVTEEDIAFTQEQDPHNALLQAEKMFQDREDWVCTVVRFGGLVGGSRQPGKFMAGRKHLPDGDAPVNLIHQDDCIEILFRIVEAEKWGYTFNACADEHPLRKDFYTKAALALEMVAPQFDAMEETQFKLINSQKLKDELSYVFIHPDPMLFF
ncbi:SDR family NAD(P)-dependent oxidoreductase [Pontibacter ruber]|uniref:SDR family NAD(P)-dependent oxidoreductase n=1 Tax=Pontibacter ruber TaxID=1343895 RepID=A0ABW5CRU2_9BACT|nr:SDR family NAD(P)-dependent oxidoreductase [Pontibacter ruber]